MDEGRKRDAPLDRDKRDSSSNIIPRVFEIKAPPAAPYGALPKSSLQTGCRRSSDAGRSSDDLQGSNEADDNDDELRNHDQLEWGTFLYAALRSQARMNFETHFDARSLAWRRPILL